MAFRNGAASDDAPLNEFLLKIWGNGDALCSSFEPTKMSKSKVHQPRAEGTHFPSDTVSREHLKQESFI